MSDFKFVIIGSGNISRTYTTVLNKLEGMELVGMVSRSGERPDHINSSVEMGQSIREIENDFDAVILATPNGMHNKGAIEAANLGKHVLTEKPLDITREAMDKMIEACDANNVKLAVAYQRRTNPDNKIIYNLIREGKLGNIFAADMTVKNYRPDSYYESGAWRGTRDIDGGGPFMQQASHNVDLYGWFFGMPSKIISSYGTFTHDIEVEDHGAAILKHGDDMIGTIIASTSAKPGFDGKLEIHSDKGTVVLENDIITSWQIEGMENPSQSAPEEIHSGATSASVSDTSGHENIVKDFVQAIKQDRSPLIDGKSARLATELILEIYENKIS
ncbi:Gfo/Idh/MocA family oxidoreductase [Aliifodinibius sp. S!AR15-10]|nr:Gfo/Idh/MocA family oxidoreductase [Aliifodinibius sp. S!AR15-10]